MKELQDKLAFIGQLVAGTAHSIKNVLEGLRGVYKSSPEILQPIEAFFNVDIGQRLEDPKSHRCILPAKDSKQPAVDAAV